jgi:hypothetical protein
MKIALPLLTAVVWPMSVWSQTPSSALPNPDFSPVSEKLRGVGARSGIF